MADYSLRTLLLGLALVAATGCTDGPNVPPQLWHVYKEYQTQPHYRAMACVRASYRSGCARTWRQTSAKSAADKVLEVCEKAQMTKADRMPCSLRFVGDVDVFGMKKSQVDQVIEQYQKDVESTNAPVQLTEDTQRKFEEYKTQAYPDFKAFAFDPTRGRWGIGYATRKPEQAMEEALGGCEKTGAKCELYALGTTVVSGKSQQQIASLAESYVARVVGDLDREMKGKPLTAEEIKFHLSGRTIKGTTFIGRGFLTEFGRDGTMKVQLFDMERQPLGKINPRSDEGSWWIKEDKFCRRFLHWFDGKTDCQDVVKDGDTIKFYSSGELVSRGVIVGKN